MNSNSKSGQLNAIDWNKIAIGLSVAVVGAIMTYLTDLIPNIDLGVWTPIVVSAWSVIANIVRKWLKDYTK